MESSIAVFLLRQPACERLPTTARCQLTGRMATAKPLHERTRHRTRHTNAGRRTYWQDMRACKLRSNPPAGDRCTKQQTTPAQNTLPTTTAAQKKGLRDRNSPTCTLSQNGYGDTCSWPSDCLASHGDQAG